MKSELAEKLRKHLQSLTKEEFEKEWSEIEKLGLGGPTVEEYIESLKPKKLFNSTDKIETVADLKAILADLDDDDQLCLETIDLLTGDSIDLYPFHIDVIEGIKLTDGTFVREVRLCQENNVEHLSYDERNAMIDEINTIVDNHGSFSYDDAEYANGVLISAKSRDEFQQLEIFDEDECTLVTYINNRPVNSEQIDYCDLNDENLIAVLNIAKAYEAL